MKILLVDDDEQVREAIVYALMDNLYVKADQIYQSWNGGQALRIYDKHGPFDIVLTDNQMPVMNGIQFCQKLVKEDVQPMAIIMVTGCDRCELDGLPRGVMHFNKRYPIADLIGMLKNVYRPWDKVEKRTPPRTQF
jgi:CheY-like chemotaxis protein